MVRGDWRGAVEQLTCAVVNTEPFLRAQRVDKLLDALEEEIRDAIMEGVQDWVVKVDMAAVYGSECRR